MLATGARKLRQYNEMNNFINWIAVNNTLLIRVGFTAVVVLIIVYVYRFFFMPKINNTVNNSVKETETDVINEKKTIVENKPVEEKAASLDLSVVTKKNEEIDILKAELAKLKVQVTDYEKEISDLKIKPEIQISETAEVAEVKTAEVAEANPASSETASIISMNEEASNSDLVASLNTKIEQLESRLAEYEIIAEDISEISQLRQENADLKNKLAAESTVLNDISEEIALPEEVIAEEPIVVSEAVSNEAITLASEKDVSENEIEMIDQFENIATKKEGS